MIKRLKERHIGLWNKDSIKSFLFGATFLAVSLVVERFADVYVQSLKELPVNDVLLNILPSFDIDSFIIISTLIFTFVLIGLFLFRPKYINFGIKSLALFILVRSFFITLTHLGANPHQLVFNPNSFGYDLYNLLYNSNNDFFFSGHTGVPFLMALVFWPIWEWRYLFFITSFVFGVSVLLGHIHYSIDVFSAPFITYSIFSISSKVFRSDYKLSRE